VASGILGKTSCQELEERKDEQMSIPLLFLKKMGDMNPTSADDAHDHLLKKIVASIQYQSISKYKAIKNSPSTTQG
jgi:hypothetical protein